jgi:hypothetical protein
MEQLGIVVMATVLVGAAAACGAPTAAPQSPNNQPHKALTSAERHAQAKSAMAGDVPLVVINRTRGKLTAVSVFAGNDVLESFLPLDPADHRPLESGESRQLALLKAGAYRLSTSTENNFHGDTELTLEGPTEVVVFDEKAPPTDSPTAGFTRVAVESRPSEHHAAPRHIPLACEIGIPKMSEKPKPGPTRVDGHWRCVLGGAVVGTDRVELVQLASGAISATVSGLHANTSWTGIVAGDSVGFRVANQTSGGRLKIDPGGHSLRGNGQVLDGEKCLSYTMTCTR